MIDVSRSWTLKLLCRMTIYTSLLLSMVTAGSAAETIGTVLCRDALETEHRLGVVLVGTTVESPRWWMRMNEKGPVSERPDDVGYGSGGESQLAVSCAPGVVACIPFQVIDKVTRKDRSNHMVRLMDESEVVGKLMGYIQGHRIESSSKTLASSKTLLLSGLETISVDISPENRKQIWKALAQLGNDERAKSTVSYFVKTDAKQNGKADKPWGPFGDLKLAWVYTTSSPRISGLFIVGTDVHVAAQWVRDFVIVKEQDMISSSLEGFKGEMKLSAGKDQIDVSVLTPTGRAVSGKLAFAEDKVASNATVLAAIAKNGVKYIFHLSPAVSVKSAE